MLRLYLFLRGFLSFLRFILLGKDKAIHLLHYGELHYLSFFSKRSYINLKNSILSSNKERIKISGKCKVGFLIYTPSMWSLDGLYQLFKNDSAFSPSIVVAPLVDTTRQTYEETIAYFEQKGYKVESPENDSFDINSFNLLIYTTPFPFEDRKINAKYLRLDKLIVYVSYSYILSARIEKIEYPTYILSWKVFCDSPFYKHLIERNTRAYTGNAVYCGYPKMDNYYLKNIDSENADANKKTIIYSPHQSVNYTGVKSATFEMNGWFLLYLACKYKEQINWIIKPHPLLRKHSVVANLFTNEEGYDDYLNRWKETGVAKVVENGDYMDSFRESDAMITDSISFLAEYQFTGKPLLLLESGKQTYNEFGQSICGILYRCAGNDYDRIERFIQDLIEGKDEMRATRESFFKENLSYYDGEYAFEKMYNILNNELFQS